METCARSGNRETTRSSFATQIRRNGGGSTDRSGIDGRVNLIKESLSFGARLGAHRAQDLPAGWWWAGRSWAAPDTPIIGARPVLARFITLGSDTITEHVGMLARVQHFPTASYIVLRTLHGYRAHARVMPDTTVQLTDLGRLLGNTVPLSILGDA